jgi:hypothetical protein
MPPSLRKSKPGPAQLSAFIRRLHASILLSVSANTLKKLTYHWFDVEGREEMAANLHAVRQEGGHRISADHTYAVGSNLFAFDHVLPGVQPGGKPRCGSILLYEPKL